MIFRQRQLWDKLSAVYQTGSVVCATCVAIYVQEKEISTGMFRVGFNAVLGLYLFNGFGNEGKKQLKSEGETKWNTA